MAPDLQSPLDEKQGSPLPSPHVDDSPASSTVYGDDVAGRVNSQQEHYLGPSDSSLSPAPSKNIIEFAHNDPGNPYNWSTARKAFVVFAGVVTTLNSTLGSSLPTGDIDKLATHYGIVSNAQLVLPVSIYLVGYVLGPILFGPLSEGYGRQWVMLLTFAGYTIFTLAVCVAPDYASFIVFRLFCGIFAASPVSVTGGIYADLYSDPVQRGHAMIAFMVAVGWGPLIAPFASGYLSVYSWQWPLWFGLIFAGVSWIPVAFLPETFGPIILARRAKKIRKESSGPQVYAQIEIEKSSLRNIITVVLMRPIRMFFTEPLVLFSCLFLSLVYGIYFMFFQVFPLIYEPIYGFTPGEEGLTFLALGIGFMLALPIYLWWDRYLEKAKAREASWALSEEYRRLPLGCIGGPFFSIGMFWVGWAARRDVPWIVPVLGGVPLGTGFLLLFMSLLNYIVDAYEIYAASGLAAASCSRSVFGVALPFAGKALFSTLGIDWACSLLAFLSLAMCAVPFVFLKYGDVIRKRSKFCQQLIEEKKKREADGQHRREKQERREEKEKEKAPTMSEGAEV